MLQYGSYLMTHAFNSCSDRTSRTRIRMMMMTATGEGGPHRLGIWSNMPLVAYVHINMLNLSGRKSIFQYTRI